MSYAVRGIEGREWRTAGFIGNKIFVNNFGRPPTKPTFPKPPDLHSPLSTAHPLVGALPSGCMPPRARKRKGAPVSKGAASKSRRVKTEVADPSNTESVNRFPATIQFEDPFENGVGKYVRPPGDWNDSADRCAARVSREVRLLGTVKLTVVLAEDGGHGPDPTIGEGTKKTKPAKKEATISSLLDSLAAPIRPSKRFVNFDHRHTTGVETWNTEGEPGNSGQLLPINKLYEAVDTGLVTIAEQHGPQLIAALASAQHPQTSPWKVPLIRSVCVAGDAIECVQSVTNDESSAQLTFAVYCSRLMFELIADDNVNFIVQHLTPAGAVSHPVSATVLHEPSFAVDRSHAGTVDQFTLPGLLSSMVTEGGPSASQPPGLKIQMLDFQRQTLFWMRTKETSDRGLNGQFWEERRWADADDVLGCSGGAGDATTSSDVVCAMDVENGTTKNKSKKPSATNTEGKFWYFALAGELRLHEPPIQRGGMLCEEMGLGKTVEVFGLVCADMVEARQSSKTTTHTKDFKNLWSSDSEFKIKSRATLIVVPPPLLRQWEAECGKCVVHGYLSLKVYQGNRGKKKEKNTEGKSQRDVEFERVKTVSDADVVLCTYAQLQREASSGKKNDTNDSKVLSKIKWRRVVLDECQMVRSSTTQLAVACRGLESDFRWMVSGTPLHQSVDDLNGELNFLGVWPFCLSDVTDGFWAHKIGGPFGNRDNECLGLIHALLKGVCVRHTKAQRRMIDGTPLLTLPAAANELRVVTHGANADEAPSERFVTSFLEHHASIAARGVLQTLLVNADLDSNVPTHHVRTARALATKLLRLVRGATTSATLVRSRLREVEEAMRAASTSVTTSGRGGRANHGGFRDSAGQLNASAVEAAASADVDRVRALPAGLALLELMAPREANVSGPVAAARVSTAAVDTGRAASAFQLRNANMHSFEAGRQAWRGTSREYADAGGADLAHKLADVADGLFKILRNASERDKREADGVVKVDALCGSVTSIATSKRETGRARLHRLQHAFPGRLVKLCNCPGWGCGCSTNTMDSSDNKFPACCESAGVFRALSSLENRSGRTKEATAVASAADAAAKHAVAAARAPLPKLRWLLAVELITSGVAFDVFGNIDAGVEYFDSDPNAKRDAKELRKRSSYRFLRRAFLAKKLECFVNAADAKVDAARTLAQDRDVNDPDSKPRRAINRAPEHVQEAYRDAVANAKSARATQRDQTPGGVRVFGKTSLLQIVLPKLFSKTGNNLMSAHAVRDTLHSAVERVKQSASRLTEEIGTLAPYMRALASAGLNGVDDTSLDHATVKQSGFALVDEITSGRRPQCCICCAPANEPTIARCMHLACARCIITWFHAAPLHGAAANAGGAPCPLCRKPFFIEELIRLLPNEVDESGEGGSNGGGTGTSTGVIDPKSKGKSKGKGKGTAVPSTTDSGSNDSGLTPTPKFSFAATPALFARLPLPPHENPNDHRDGRYPALSMDGGRFLAHVHRACMRQSPKISALVSDLKQNFKRKGGSGKAVVFSQLRDALSHAANALTWEGIGNVLVDGGGVNARKNTNGAQGVDSQNVSRPEDDTARAVAQFRDDPKCSVLLLHAGSAAAGLTLTHADLVILLEPFLSPGDEAQAANRVHRIGQTRNVRCVKYYVEGSVEERLLAFRERQSGFGGRDDVGDGASGAGHSVSAGATGDDDAATAAALGVMHEGSEAFGTNMSRSQFDRMRFVFGISAGE